MKSLLEKIKPIRSKRVVFIPNEFIISTKSFTSNYELNIHKGLGNKESSELICSVKDNYCSFKTLERKSTANPKEIILREYNKIGETPEGWVFNETSQTPYPSGEESYNQLDKRMKEVKK